MRTTWLAAQYHFPSTYMCRMPMSNPLAARALPTPGPATIRRALLRNAIELFGIAATRDWLFPVIRAIPIRVQPPACVAISRQPIRLYKGIFIQRRTQLQDAIGYREVATADGLLMIYLHVGRDVAHAISETLSLIASWGSADSLTCCMHVAEAEPPTTVVVPLQSIHAAATLRQRYIGLATEFRDHDVTWAEIGADDTNESSDAIASRLWVWPLSICEQHRNGMILRTSRSDV